MLGVSLVQRMLDAEILNIKGKLKSISTEIGQLQKRKNQLSSQKTMLDRRLELLKTQVASFKGYKLVKKEKTSPV